MFVFQEESGQIGLDFGIILNKNDLDQILEHEPININIGLLRINISFCEPPKPISFDINKSVYFISLCFRELRFLKDGNFLVAIHMIEGVQFMISIFFRNDTQNFKGESTRGPKSYMILRGSTLE
jgi:hypothetical protein